MKTSIEVGTTINNGAIVMAYDEAHHRMLCEWDNEYVVWTHVGNKNAESGHYFGDDKQRALTVFAVNMSNKYWEDV